jgi:uncharacterized protein YjbJ (UPF0337 family)
MNADIMEGKWKQMRGQMKEWWGKLTDDDFDVIAGRRDKLVGTLQESTAGRSAMPRTRWRGGSATWTRRPDQPPAGTTRP